MQVTKLGLKEALEFDACQEMGIYASAVDQKKKEIKINTKMNFTQTK